MDTERNPITWEKFKGVFYDNYFLKVVREQKESEFVDLVQGSMIVEQYAAKFIELSCFGPHMILTEAKKASKFQKRLDERLRHHLIASGVDNYAESVQLREL